MVVSKVLSSLLAAMSALIAYIIWKITYAFLLSPLRGIPGPPIAKTTSGWLTFHDLTGTRTKTLHHLHQKYGPIVCIGPKEVSFNSIAASHQIHGPQSDFTKDGWYKYVSEPGLFNEINNKRHRQRRKLMNHAFSQQVVNDMEPVIKTQMQGLVHFVEDRREHRPINMRHLMHMLAFDIATAVFFGKEDEGAGGLNSDTPPQFIQDLGTAFLVRELRRRLPILLWLASIVPIKSIQLFCSSPERIYQHGKDALADYLTRLGRNSGRRDFLSKLIRSNPKDASTGLPDAACAIEVTNLTFAGTDTTGMTLCYLLWELSQYPDMQDRLREELRGVSEESGIPIHQDLVNLPYLNAVIQETLRKHPPVVMGLLRSVPLGGKTMEGHFIPENTTVSVSTYSAHFNEHIFPNPTTFDPQRWLSTPGDTQAMREHFMPFSRGARNCIGQNMAMFELRLTVATLIRRYRLVLDESMRPKDMDFVDYFIMMPKGGKCLIKFELVEDE